MQKTIRVWDGKTVIAILAVTPTGYTASRSGGAEWSGKVDIEIDPFKGLMVDHSEIDGGAGHVHEFPSCPLCVNLGMEQAGKSITVMQDGEGEFQ